MLSETFWCVNQSLWTDTGKPLGSATRRVVKENMLGNQGKDIGMIVLTYKYRLRVISV